MLKLLNNMRQKQSGAAVLYCLQKCDFAFQGLQKEKIALKAAIHFQLVNVFRERTSNALQAVL